MCVRRKPGMSDIVFSSQSEEICASRSPKKFVCRELEMSNMTVWRLLRKTAREALPSSLVAVSETDRPHRPK